MRRVINVSLSRVLDINIYMLRSIVFDNSGEKCACVECQRVFLLSANDRDPIRVMRQSGVTGCLCLDLCPGR